MERIDPRRTVQATMTAQLVGRQFLYLFLLATCLLFITFFINFYGFTFARLWNGLPLIDLRIISIHPILLGIYGYVLLTGILFALGPSERSFNLFFLSMILALVVVNHDQSVLSIVDWGSILGGAGVKLTVREPVSAFKILFAGPFFLVLIVMHYNILTDDFARRMLRRGIPTEEVARIRANVFKVLVPTVLMAAACASGLALLGEFSQLAFQGHGLLPKLQLVLLAALVVPMAFLIRGILRDLARAPRESLPKGPNR